MTCVDCLRYFENECDRDQSQPPLPLHVTAHVAECLECQVALDEQRLLIDAVAQWKGAVPTVSLVERVIDNLAGMAITSELDETQIFAPSGETVNEMLLRKPASPSRRTLTVVEETGEPVLRTAGRRDWHWRGVFAASVGVSAMIWMHATRESLVATNPGQAILVSEQPLGEERHTTTAAAAAVVTQQDQTRSSDVVSGAAARQHTPPVLMPSLASGSVAGPVMWSSMDLALAMGRVADRPATYRHFADTAWLTMVDWVVPEVPVMHLMSRPTIMRPENDLADGMWNDWVEHLKPYRDSVGETLDLFRLTSLPPET